MSLLFRKPKSVAPTLFSFIIPSPSTAESAELILQQPKCSPFYTCPNTTETESKEVMHPFQCLALAFVTPIHEKTAPKLDAEGVGTSRHKQIMTRHETLRETTNRAPERLIGERRTSQKAVTSHELSLMSCKVCSGGAAAF